MLLLTARDLALQRNLAIRAGLAIEELAEEIEALSARWGAPEARTIKGKAAVIRSMAVHDVREPLQILADTSAM